ncbi:putative methyltransferase [Metallosphaera yellowstonensis MK1]|uniref:Putative methyltransferase n=1 Tax=Metallosphaera yellowstonensis MK1 TaxID=671065 RepID=H2C3F4_9CREN|nr:putative methyltransferase [Metallosphaera yellowstonensis MK1]
MSEPTKELEVVECNPLEVRTKRLNEVIPGASSFYVIGDIAIVSYKGKEDPRSVGEAIIRLVPRVRSVFLKRRVVGELRLGELIPIAGEGKTTTSFVEGRISFFVDVSKVYVNPSLAIERMKVSERVDRGDLVLDAFTGYGAFALHMAKRGAYVVAGDLNLDGLIMAIKSIRLNGNKFTVDLVHYDANFLPFRDAVFKLVIGDNPSMIDRFIGELCRVTRGTLLVYRLGPPQEGWERVNEYSKDLIIAKREIRCHQEDSDHSSPQFPHQIPI